MKTTLTHPRLGEITLSRTRRARRITLCVKPDGEVRLSIPYTATREAGFRFLESKIEWVEACRRKMAERFPQRPLLPPYATRRHTLQLEAADTDRIRVRLTAERIEVRHPAALPPDDEAVQQAIRQGIREALRAEAKELLPERLAVLAARHGFRTGKVTIRATVSKWGSCSARNDFSLSLYLLLLPDRLIDYVLLHELCHTVHKNHGPRFHALLDSLCGGESARLNRELKNFRPQI